MTIDNKAEAILAKNFVQECGDPSADAAAAAKAALRALHQEGLIIASDPEA